jgi:hypothetical protein
LPITVWCCGWWEIMVMAACCLPLMSAHGNSSNTKPKAMDKEMNAVAFPPQ